MKKIYRLLLILIVVCSCSWEEETVRIEGKRTILVYMAGDNDLSEEINVKLESLRKGWKPAYGNLLVFADTYRGKPVLMRIMDRKGERVTDTLKVYANENAASAELLREVIRDTKEHSPSRNYGLILFSHATGWLPAGAFINPVAWSSSSRSGTRSLFKDGNREEELDDFAAALPDKMFDFIIFDMCFMAGAETIYALRNKTPYMIASSTEIVSPGFTPVYAENLGLLYQSEPDLKGFASAFFSYFDKQQGAYRSATVSVIRTSAMDSMAGLVRAIAPVDLTQQQIDNLQYFDRRQKTHLFFDFGEWLHTSAATPTQHARIDEILDSLVILKLHTARLINININKHSGLSVYVPQASLPALNVAYEKTFWREAVR